MAAPPFFSFADFFPAQDHDEVEALLDHLDSVSDLDTIYKLANGGQGRVGTEVGLSSGLFGHYLDATQGVSGGITSGVVIVDPDDPTPEEQVILDGLLPQFYGAWPESKRDALAWTIEQVAADASTTNPYSTLLALEGLTEMAASALLEPGIHGRLGNYYVQMAGRYLSQALRPYELIGQVVDGDDKPRSGVKVSAKDALLDEERSFGSTFTNRTGHYKIVFTAIDLDAPYELELTFSHPELGTPDPDDIVEYKPGDPNAVVVSELTFTPLPSTSATIASTGVDIPTDVSDYLTGEGITITRLEDIRKLGGLKNLPTDTIDKEDADLLKLDALANLELVSNDVPKNLSLIARGYMGVTDLATASRATFVKENTDLFGDLGAAKMHYQAQAAQKHLLNFTVATAGQDQARTSCGCKDCQSAVSPLAYLADLLLFITTRVENDGEAIDITYLEEHFHQRFADLPAACSQTEATICQNRIAAEVLRAYLDEHEPEGDLVAAMNAAIQRYLIDAYRLLLINLGTSYEEVRRIQHASEADRKRLRDRLGIADLPEDDPCLEQIFFDLSTPPSAPGPLNTFEQQLETVFGLRDSQRDMLLVTPVSKWEQWTRQYFTNLWSTQDRLQTPYHKGEKPVIDPDIVTIDDLRNPKDDDPVFQIWAARRAWLDELFDLSPTTYPGVPVIDHSAQNNTITLFGETDPDIVGEELHYASDIPEENFSETYTVVSHQVVDGNLVVHVDAELLIDRAGGTITFDTDPEEFENELTRSYDAPDLGAMLDLMTTGEQYPFEDTLIKPASSWDQAPLELIDNLAARAVLVRKGDTAAIDDLWDDLQLLPAELLFLVEFLTTYTGFDPDPEDEEFDLHLENNHSPEKWAEFRDILITVFKRAARETWLAEENYAGIVLGPLDFMPSMVEPKAGHWPPILPEGVPALEPGLLTAVDLPEVTALNRQHFSTSPDTTSLEVLLGRADDLAGLREDVEAAHTEGFDVPNLAALLEFVYGSGAYDEFDGLKDDLANPLTSAAAIATITGELRLTVDEFQLIMGLDGIGPHATKDLQRMYSILTRVKKELDLYEEWLEDEEDVPYWKMHKARLPKWRSSVEERKAWLKALADHSARPAIDADLIGPGDLATPFAPNKAYVLWKARYEQMHSGGGWLNGLTNDLTGVSDQEDFDAFTQEELGHVEAGLHVLDVERESGRDIRPRIAQLNLMPGEFNFLIECRNVIVATSATSLTAEEKKDIVRILAQVRKRRHFHHFRVEEEADGVDHTPKWFRVVSDPTISYPPRPAFPLLRWLAAETDLSLWRRKLQGRIDQQRNALKTLADRVQDTDGDMVLHLRDALIKGTGRNARELGDELLIDLENSCCQKTNRIAQAIETLQQFLWKLRANDLPAEYELVELTAEDFDSAWTWMGSYANWRAAMFVFLYPENVMPPSLRRDPTPAFKEVLEATRNNRRFGPGEACDIAQEYTDYINDISDLEVVCAQQANAFIGKGKCGSPHNTQRKLTFVFAQANRSKRLYFSTIDTNDMENVVQTSYWSLIPNIEDKPMVHGCDFYHNDKHHVNHIYLFYTLPKTNDSSVFAIKYSLETMQWEEEAIELKIAHDNLRNEDYNNTHFDPKKFNTKILGVAIQKNTYDWQAPKIAVSIAHESGVPYTFSLHLNREGNDFQSGEDWDKLTTNFLGTTDIHSYEGDPQNILWRDYIYYSLARELRGTIIDYWHYESVNNPSPEHWWYNLMEFFVLRDISKNSQGEDVTVTKVVRKVFDRQYGERRHQLVAISPYTPANRHLTGLILDPIADRLHRFAKFYPMGTEVIGDGYYVKQYPPEIFIHSSSTNALDWLIEGSDPIDQIGPYMNGGMKLVSVNPAEWFAGGSMVVLSQWLSEGQIVLNKMESDAFTWQHDLIRLVPKFHADPIIGPITMDADLSVAQQNAEHSWHLNEQGNKRLLGPVEETFYFVPMQIALQLHANGHYQAALDWFRSVYDYTRPVDERKIWYGLIREEEGTPNPEYAADWYVDPLNPHAIAAIRPHTYTRYTILCIAQCLLDYADAEYTADNSESVPRARELYEEAIGLLEILRPEPPCPIDQAIMDLSHYVELTPWVLVLPGIVAELEPLNGSPGLPGVLEDIIEVMEGAGDLDEQIAAVKALVDAAVAGVVTPTIGETLEAYAADTNAQAEAVMAIAGDVSMGLSQTAAKTFDQTMKTVTGLEIAELQSKSIPWLADAKAASPFPHGYAKEFFTPGKKDLLNDFSAAKPYDAFLINSPFPDIWLSGLPFRFCVVPNPIVDALLMHAHVNLFKIRNCMNIAGMVRELSPFAAPTDSTTGVPAIGVNGSLTIPSHSAIPPSAYRYRALVERARQLVAMAQQVEAAFLSTLEKLDAERYSQLRAEQDIETSKANIKLQDLKIVEAKSGEQLANLQRDRAIEQVNGLNGMIDAGLLSWEGKLQDLYLGLSISQMVQATGMAAYQAGDALASADAFSKFIASLAGIARVVALGAEITGINYNYNIQLASLQASLERRKQEWEFQKTLAQKDVEIGNQQIKLAQDRVRIVGQEREIAAIQHEHARATLDFLKNKFTSAELYEWMSRVLEDVYSWFLQEATAIALLAQRQLAFERQLDLPPFIRTDYWVVDGGSMGGVDLTGEGAVDRRGLTGSTRLLKDLTELDQYAFSTNSPKLQLSKTIALSELAPEELMALRDTGIARFHTTQELFDRDYPGHFLRLIRKVSVTVIALNSPTKGIRATLANGGTSRVITGGTIFQERTIKRYVEQIALSGGVSDHGVFQLQGEGEFLNPFEGSGVDTSWEFRMEKAANPFDFGSIADVLFTIEYDALNSFTHRANVISQLNEKPAPAALAISMKHNLPDQWFDLHHPEQTETPYTVSFHINPTDLAPNIINDAELAVDRVMVYAVMKDGSTFNHDLAVIHDDTEKLSSFVQGLALFHDLAGSPPTGEWTMEFSMDAPGGNAFDDDKVEDIMVIIHYSGKTPPYSL